MYGELLDSPIKDLAAIGLAAEGCPSPAKELLASAVVADAARLAMPKSRRQLAMPEQETVESQAECAAGHTAPLLSLRQVLFDPASAMASPAICVPGTIVVLDLEASRLDVSCEGAKLIVALDKLDKASFQRLTSGECGIGSAVFVTGSIKKQARRTFLEASAVLPAAAPHT